MTRSRYLDSELQLRISIELSLKQLLVGGLERVYEIGRCFRNEDLDSTHSPEFTMLELYWAVRRLPRHAPPDGGALRAIGGANAGMAARRPRWRARPRGCSVPRSLPSISCRRSRSGAASTTSSPGRLRRSANSPAGAERPYPPTPRPGVFLDKLFEHHVEPTSIGRRFVVDHPASTTPLAKRHRSLAGRVERFEIHCRGFEIGNCYTELNDPDEQERRFQEQLAARGEDRYAYDAEFVEALRHGLPPATGIGFGIERIVMALTGAKSIKDVILFPRFGPAEGPRRAPR